LFFRNSGRKPSPLFLELLQKKPGWEGAGRQEVIVQVGDGEETIDAEVCSIPAPEKI